MFLFSQKFISYWQKISVFQCRNFKRLLKWVEQLMGQMNYSNISPGKLNLLTSWEENVSQNYIKGGCIMGLASPNCFHNMRLAWVTGTCDFYFTLFVFLDCWVTSQRSYPDSISDWLREESVLGHHVPRGQLELVIEGS